MDLQPGKIKLIRELGLARVQALTDQLRYAIGIGGFNDAEGFHHLPKYQTSGTEMPLIRNLRMPHLSL